MLLDHEGDYLTVKSSERGILQHNALSWQIVGGDFVFLDDMSADTKRVNKLLSDWLAGMDDDFREKFTDAFFGVLYATKSTTLSDLMDDKPALLRAFSSADSDTRQALSEGFRMLLGESGKSIGDWLKLHRTDSV